MGVGGLVTGEVARNAEDLKAWYSAKREKQSNCFTTHDLAEEAEIMALKYKQINILAK